MERHNFGPGFGTIPRYTRKNNSKLNALRSRKTKKLLVTESEKNKILSLLAKEYNVPQDVENVLIQSSKTKLHTKLARDLKLFSRLKNVHNSYPELVKLRVSMSSTRLFYTLDHKYREPYVKALEKDIDLPHKNTFPWLITHWRELIRYIGSKKIPESESLKHFISVTNIPSKVRFRQIVYIVDDYFKDYDYDYDNV